MSELASMVYFQREIFEKPRNLWRHNTPEFGLDRTIEEIEEARAELTENPNWGAFLDELADVVIFVTSVAAHAIDQAGLEDTALSDAVIRKLNRNLTKYDEDFFGLQPISISLVNARHWWNLGLHENPPEGNDYY